MDHDGKGGSRDGSVRAETGAREQIRKREGRDGSTGAEMGVQGQRRECEGREREHRSRDESARQRWDREADVSTRAYMEACRQRPGCEERDGSARAEKGSSGAETLARGRAGSARQRPGAQKGRDGSARQRRQRKAEAGAQGSGGSNGAICDNRGDRFFTSALIVSSDCFLVTGSRPSKPATCNTNGGTLCRRACRLGSGVAKVWPSGSRVFCLWLPFPCSER